MFGKQLLRSRAAIAFVICVSMTKVSLGQGAADPQPEGANPNAPEIRGVLRNSELVLERLKLVLDLTSEEDQQQYDTLQEFIEVFLIGVDRAKPVRMDVFTVEDRTTYRLDVPVVAAEFRDFWQLNLVPLGIPVQQFAKQPNLFKLGGRPNDAFTGLMLYAPNERAGYATIAEEASLLPSDTKARDAGVQQLLESDYDASFYLLNKAEGVEARHTRFAADKSKVLDELKRRTDESAADFELRKFAAGIQYDESARIYSEAKQFIAGLSVSNQPVESHLGFELEALPGTPLADSINLLGSQASAFASVQAPRNATSTGRVNFQLDDFRKEHFLAMSKKFRENELANVAQIEGATDEQKQATQDFLNALFDRFDVGVEAGTIDAFVDMTKNNEGIYTVVGGAASPNAPDWVPVLEMVPTLKNAPEFKKDIAKVGDYAVHEITFKAGAHPDYEALFGSPRLVVATGGNVVWYAAGPEADAQLKTAIEAAATPGEPSTTIASFRGELLPAFRILQQRMGERGNQDLRTRAIEAFTNGEGQLNMSVTKEGAKVIGRTIVDVGVLRLIGSSLAEMSRENLAE